MSQSYYTYLRTTRATMERDATSLSLLFCRTTLQPVVTALVSYPRYRCYFSFFVSFLSGLRIYWQFYVMHLEY